MDGGSADSEDPNAGGCFRVEIAENEHSVEGGEDGGQKTRSGTDDDDEEEENPLPPELQEEMHEAFLSMVCSLKF